MIKLVLTIVLSFGFFASTVHAQDQDIEIRVHEIGRALRCVVCQNQSIDMSDAPLAVDMRKFVRDRVLAGDSNTDVNEYVQSIYGDFVLLKPPAQLNTYVLWFLPFFILLCGLTLFLRKSSSVERLEMT